jgi:hypothetical protein
MEINCGQVVEKYLLNQNSLYVFSFPIALLVSIVVFGIMKAYKVSKNSYVNQILIPVVTFLLVLVIIDIIARAMIPKRELKRLTNLCKLWMHDPAVRDHPILSKMINMELVKNYNVENFTVDSEAHNMHSTHAVREEYTTNSVHEEQNVQNDVQNVEKNNENNENNENILLLNDFDNIKGLSPFPIEYNKTPSKCIENSNSCNICSGDVNNINAPIPGPQWMPLSAETMQDNLKNNIYTPSKCRI